MYMYISEWDHDNIISTGVTGNPPPPLKIFPPHPPPGGRFPRNFPPHPENFPLGGIGIFLEKK